MVAGGKKLAKGLSNSQIKIFRCFDVQFDDQINLEIYTCP